MRHGPYVFLGLFFALALSWLGMIATPQFQLGNAQPTNVPPANIIYPAPFSGMANQGREIYRANGCAYCHTQVVRQDGTRLDVFLSSVGTNQPAVVQALVELRPDWSPAQAQQLLAKPPVSVLTVATSSAADRAQKTLSDAGAEATIRVVPLGPEIERGWGTRLSVAPDYLYAKPLLLGTARLGPDLTNIGMRRPDRIWHLLHLYNPKLQVPGSTMPRFPFLFQTGPRKVHPSSDALPISGELEIRPTPQAEALVAYLMNLRADMPLFEAPGPPVIGTSAPAGDTNQPAETATGTNAASSAAAATNQAGPK